MPSRRRRRHRTNDKAHKQFTHTPAPKLRKQIIPYPSGTPIVIRSNTPTAPNPNSTAHTPNHRRPGIVLRGRRHGDKSLLPILLLPIAAHSASFTNIRIADVEHDHTLRFTSDFRPPVPFPLPLRPILPAACRPVCGKRARETVPPVGVCNATLPFYVLHGVTYDDTGTSASILLLKPGDLRNALYSLSQELPALSKLPEVGERPLLHFTLVDDEVTVTARNILILYLLSDTGVPVSEILAIWFAPRLEEKSFRALCLAIGTLLSISEDDNDENNPLLSLRISFENPTDRHAVHARWRSWLSLQDKLDWDDISTIRTRAFNTEHNDKLSENGLPESLDPDRVAIPAASASQEDTMRALRERDTILETLNFVKCGSFLPNTECGELYTNPTFFGAGDFAVFRGVVGPFSRGGMLAARGRRRSMYGYLLHVVDEWREALRMWNEVKAVEWTFSTDDAMRFLSQVDVSFNVVAAGCMSDTMGLVSVLQATRPPILSTSGVLITQTMDFLEYSISPEDYLTCNLHVNPERFQSTYGWRCLGFEGPIAPVEGDIQLEIPDYGNMTKKEVMGVQEMIGCDVCLTLFWKPVVKEETSMRFLAEDEEMKKVFRHSGGGAGHVVPAKIAKRVDCYLPGSHLAQLRTLVRMRDFKKVVSSDGWEVCDIVDAILASKVEERLEIASIVLPSENVYRKVREEARAMERCLSVGIVKEKKEIRYNAIVVDTSEEGDGMRLSWVWRKNMRSSKAMKIYVGTAVVDSYQMSEVHRTALRREHLPRWVREFMQQRGNDWCNEKFLRRKMKDEEKECKEEFVSGVSPTEKVGSSFVTQCYCAYIDCGSRWEVCICASKPLVKLIDERASLKWEVTGEDRTIISCFNPKTNTLLASCRMAGPIAYSSGVVLQPSRREARIRVEKFRMNLFSNALPCTWLRAKQVSTDCKNEDSNTDSEEQVRYTLLQTREFSRSVRAEYLGTMGVRAMRNPVETLQEMWEDVVLAQSRRWVVVMQTDFKQTCCYSGIVVIDGTKRGIFTDDRTGLPLIETAVRTATCAEVFQGMTCLSGKGESEGCGSSTSASTGDGDAGEERNDGEYIGWCNECIIKEDGVNIIFITENFFWSLRNIFHFLHLRTKNGTEKAPTILQRGGVSPSTVKELVWPSLFLRHNVTSQLYEKVAFHTAAEEKYDASTSPLHEESHLLSNDTHKAIYHQATEWDSRHRHATSLTTPQETLTQLRELRRLTNDMIPHLYSGLLPVLGAMTIPDGLEAVRAWGQTDLGREWPCVITGTIQGILYDCCVRMVGLHCAGVSHREVWDERVVEVLTLFLVACEVLGAMRRLGGTFAELGGEVGVLEDVVGQVRQEVKQGVEKGYSSVRVSGEGVGGGVGEGEGVMEEFEKLIDEIRRDLRGLKGEGGEGGERGEKGEGDGGVRGEGGGDSVKELPSSSGVLDGKEKGNDLLMELKTILKLDECHMVTDAVVDDEGEDKMAVKDEESDEVAVIVDGRGLVEEAGNTEGDDTITSAISLDCVTREEVGVIEGGDVMGVDADNIAVVDGEVDDTESPTLDAVNLPEEGVHYVEVERVEGDEGAREGEGMAEKDENDESATTETIPVDGGDQAGGAATQKQT